MDIYYFIIPIQKKPSKKINKVLVSSSYPSLSDTFPQDESQFPRLIGISLAGFTAKKNPAAPTARIAAITKK